MVRGYSYAANSYFADLFIRVGQVPKNLWYGLQCFVGTTPVDEYQHPPNSRGLCDSVQRLRTHSATQTQQRTKLSCHPRHIHVPRRYCMSCVRQAPYYVCAYIAFNVSYSTLLILILKC